MFSVASASDVVVITNGDALVPGPTVSENPFSAVRFGLLLSCTSAVNEAVPVLLGVPEIIPSAASVKPAGNFPLATLQVYPGLSPPGRGGGGGGGAPLSRWRAMRW